MPLIPLRFKPGVNRDQTNYSNEGGWWACDKIRFRSGYPEKIGGWISYGATTVIGTCRSMFGWVTSYTDNLLALGTNKKVYIDSGSIFFDITPLRDTTAAGDVTFTATNGSTTVTVLDLGSNAVAGAYVTFTDAVTLSGGFLTGTPAGTSTGTATFTAVTQDSTSGDGYGAEFTIDAAGGVYTINAVTAAGNAYAIGDTITVLGTALGGATPANDLTITVATVTAGTVTAAVLNQEYEIATAINADAYTITVAIPANASDTGDGGTATVGAYQINPGLANPALGYGWGAGGWGRGGWGSGWSVPLVNTLTAWWFDNFDNDLLMNRWENGYGPIYIWERGTVSSPTTSLNTRAVLLSSLAGASDVPDQVGQVFVSQNDKHLLAFGATPYGGGDFDPMLIRWATQDDPTNWTPAPTNSAGFIRVSRGSVIKRAFATRQEILVFTDTSLNSLQFTGTADVFALQEINNNISLMGPRAIATANNAVFWMGRDKFYFYTGRLETLPTTLWQHVFQNFNYDRPNNVFASTNEGFNEIWWFYCSAGSNDIDSYVVFNYVERIWYYGTLDRTAWLDSGLRTYPQAVNASGQVYDHEYGVDADGAAIVSYIESSDFDLEDGEQFIMTRRIIPDINFTGSTAAAPEVDIELMPRNFPGAAYRSEPPERVVRTTATDYTDQVFIRARARSMAFKILSDTTGVAWQLGNPRLDGRPDGRR